MSRKIKSGLIQMSLAKTEGEGTISEIKEAMLQKHIPFIEDAGKQGVFDEFDQPFKHLRLTGKVAVQGPFGDPHFFGQGCGGNASTGAGFQHMGQGLQNLFFA